MSGGLDIKILESQTIDRIRAYMKSGMEVLALTALNRLNILSRYRVVEKLRNGVEPK